MTSEGDFARPLTHLEEEPMHDGLSWLTTGPRGRLWVIVWQPDRTRDTMRAWPAPAGRTAYRDHAATAEEARRKAVAISRQICA